MILSRFVWFIQLFYHSSGLLHWHGLCVGGDGGGEGEVGVWGSAITWLSWCCQWNNLEWYGLLILYWLRAFTTFIVHPTPIGPYHLGLLHWHRGNYIIVLLELEPRFNIKMSSYQYRKSHCGDESIVRWSYLHYKISYTGKTTSLYWISPLEVCQYLDHLFGYRDSHYNDQMVFRSLLLESQYWQDNTFKLRQAEWGHVSIKLPPYQYRNFHYKKVMFIIWSSIVPQIGFYIETGLYI